MPQRTPPPYYRRTPEILDCQLSNGRFQGCGRFDDPEKFLFDVLNAMPLKFLRDYKQVIKTYSRLVTIPYPDLPFEEHKMEILQLAAELTYAVSASNALYDIRKLDGIDVASMAKVQGYDICKDTTFYLHAVHLSLLKFIVGLYGPPDSGLYIRMQDQWEEIPANPHKQLMYQFHGVDGGFVTLDDQVDLDDEFSSNTIDPDPLEYRSEDNSTDSARAYGPEIIIHGSEQHEWNPKTDQFDINKPADPDVILFPPHFFEAVEVNAKIIWNRPPSEIEIVIAKESEGDSESTNSHSNEPTTKKSKTE